MKQEGFFITKKSHLKRNVCIVLALVLTSLAILYDANTAYTKENDEIMEGLSSSLIRFHVIANSDSAEDQALKVKVKDEVIGAMKELLEDSNSIEESRELIVAQMSEIKQLAESVLAENGSKDSVTIGIQEQTFPLKEYGDIVLPPGKYEALLIKIGAAQGKNWWCILFPPLCFVDATHGVIDDDSKNALKKVLTADEYTSIIMNKDQKVNIKVKSKLMQWFEEKEDTLGKESLFAEIFHQK
ncbi:MAG: stage II sporulation protein R [Vallitaleaceae bacterium]|nr:stage II sporulation protein R [Vallitaleaceae bacterium]